MPRLCATLFEWRLDGTPGCVIVSKSPLTQWRIEKQFDVSQARRLRARLLLATLATAKLQTSLVTETFSRGLRGADLSRTR